MATVPLSRLQRQILAWLWRQHHLGQDRTVPNYPALVRGLPPTAMRVPTSVKHLEQKRLVRVHYAPDGQPQRVQLTEAGWDCARTIWVT